MNIDKADESFGSGTGLGSVFIVAARYEFRRARWRKG